MGSFTSPSALERPNHEVPEPAIGGILLGVGVPVQVELRGRKLEGGQKQLVATAVVDLCG